MKRRLHLSGRQFDRIAADYAQHAAIQTEVAGRLLERLDGLKFEPGSVLEIGCADGRQCLALHRRFPRARILGLDWSRRMLAAARARRGWWRPRFDLVQGDAARLPLAESSVDLVYANLSLGWLPDLDAALGGLRRVLRPDGLLLLSLFGPDTLREWRPAAERAGRVLPALPDVQRLGAALVRAGFAEPVLDTDWITSAHSGPRALLEELRACGLLPATHRGLADRGRRQLLRELSTATGPEAGSLQVTWEVVSASAWAPRPGQPMRTAGGEEASIPVSSIGVRRRNGSGSGDP